VELPFEAQAPGEAGAFAFRVLQTYEDGSVGEWTGPEGSEEPAAFVKVTSAGGGAAEEGAEAAHHGEDGSLSEEGIPETGGIYLGGV